MADDDDEDARQQRLQELDQERYRLEHQIAMLDAQRAWINAGKTGEHACPWCGDVHGTKTYGARTHVEQEEAEPEAIVAPRQADSGEDAELTAAFTSGEEPSYDEG